ncbi:MAG TPA: hypothetical protein VFY16_04005 [Gemmatimonadaceae bacterium]|nr:hypothetical protein [Gemmatimonadaceae bacterium]
MQKHIARLLIAFGALTAAHPFENVASFQDPAGRAAAVLADARKALGGEERLREIRTLHAAGGYRRSMGEMQMDGELELMIERPDRLRREEAIGMPGGATLVRTEVLNGADAWEDSSQRGGMGGHMRMILRGPGGREMSEEELKEVRGRARRMELTRYLAALLLTTDAPVSHAGVAEAPDGTADVLEITPAEGPPMRLFIDRQTRRPLMLTWRGPQPRIMTRRGPEGPPPDAAQRAPEMDVRPPVDVTFEMRLDDHRPVDGINLPHQITRAVEGSVNEEWTVKTYRINTSFKNSTFTR